MFVRKLIICKHGQANISNHIWNLNWSLVVALNAWSELDPWNTRVNKKDVSLEAKLVLKIKISMDDNNL